MLLLKQILPAAILAMVVAACVCGCALCLRDKRAQAALIPFAVGLAFSLGLLLVAYEPWHIGVWAGTLLLGTGAIYAVNHRDAPYLDSRALIALRAKNRQP